MSFIKGNSWDLVINEHKILMRSILYFMKIQLLESRQAIGYMEI